VITVIFIHSATADPQGATTTRGISTRGTNPTAETQEAQAGNITGLNIDQSRITNIWQGFFGNVSGGIVLENAAGNNFYNWSPVTIDGEIYATRNTVSDWTQINCTNQTEIYEEEERLNILNESTDGINDTFSSTAHPAFIIGISTISGCRSTRPYNSSGESSEFWNVLLNSNSSNTVYTVIIDDNSNAFDNSTVDFEILVPVDREIGQSTYYFYAELN